MPEHYDVIIIGTGAGGGTLAQRWRRRARRSCSSSGATSCPAKWTTGIPTPSSSMGSTSRTDTWYDDDGQAFQPQVHYFVGGATKLYGAALYRLRPEDFGQIDHMDGPSPAWPLGYEDFEPWYTEAEWLYEVHGNRGEDPTDGPASRPYPHPAVSHEPRLQEINDNLTAAGYHPFSAPCGILLDEGDRARSRCIRCAWCDGYPCLVHAKADADVVAVRPLLDLPNVTLLVNAEAVRLETDPSGRTVSGVVVERDGNRETYAAQGCDVLARAGLVQLYRQGLVAELHQRRQHTDVQNCPPLAETIRWSFVRVRAADFMSPVRHTKV